MINSNSFAALADERSFHSTEPTSSTPKAARPKGASRRRKKKNPKGSTRSEIPKGVKVLIDESEDSSSDSTVVVAGAMRGSADGARDSLQRTLPRTLSSNSKNDGGRFGKVASGSELRVRASRNIGVLQKRESQHIGSPLSPALPQRIEEEPVPTFATYWAGEIMTQPKEFKMDVLRETERDKVYNTLWRVPYHLERFVWVGVLVCMDSLLGLLTMLPFRCGRDALFRRGPLRGNELFDRICLGIMVLGVAVHMKYVAPSSLYFGMKDITSEFLKITLVHLALDIADKILCNFGVDVLEALSGTCTLYSTGEASVFTVVADSALALMTVMLHSLVIMSSAMVWYVAMASSEKTAMLGFLIVSNFGEIKGTVFKRFDPAKLFSLTSTDVVERFHLIIAAFFILVEDMGQNGMWFPRREILTLCTTILASESLVDMIKHSVLGKFSDIRPGVYREFLRDICQKTTRCSSHNMHQCLVMEPLGPAVLLVRIAISAWYVFWGSMDEVGVGWKGRGVILSCIFGWLFACKVFLGYGLKKGAVWYLTYFERNHGRPRTPRGDSMRKKDN
ncbi:hypothetical protein BSKO_05083 [Bryopsis sp. KO-2023]|nr:hypothetical protein BSKO_05083 [Bryopsis sp. KO-2023]